MDVAAGDPTALTTASGGRRGDGRERSAAWRSGTAVGRRARRVIGPGLVSWARTHALLGVALTGAVILRVVAIAGYPSALWTNDSPGYLGTALTLKPSQTRPCGYSLLLWALRPLHSFTVVIAVQSVLAVLTAVMVYGLVLRAGLAAWPGRNRLLGAAAAVATVPILFDGNLLQLEHELLSDELFAFLLVCAVTTVLWRRRLSWWTSGLAGALLGCAAVTRTAGIPLVLVAVVGMLARWSGWRTTGAAIAVSIGAFTLPVAAYATWFHSNYDRFALTNADAIWLYGRTAGFADCTQIKPPPELAIMCPKHSGGSPGVTPAFRAMWTKDSPFRRIPGSYTGRQANAMSAEFAWAAIKTQPADYLRVIIQDTLQSISPGLSPYQFPEKGAGWLLRVPDPRGAERYGGATAQPRVVEPYARWIRFYQAHCYLPGPVLGALLAAGLTGMLIQVRQRRVPTVLPWLMSAALLVIPAATAAFDYRYVLPAIPLACLAAALAFIPPAAPAGGLPSSAGRRTASTYPPGRSSKTANSAGLN